jgi:hypothetical protein
VEQIEGHRLLATSCNLEAHSLLVASTEVRRRSEQAIRRLAGVDRLLTSTKEERCVDQVAAKQVEAGSLVSINHL